jgi:capsular polysaccharide transport system permease protein
MKTIQFNHGFKARLDSLRNDWLSIAIFPRLVRLIFFSVVLTIIYWSVIASDRYVSEASVIIRKTDSSAGPGLDISMLVSGVPGLNRSDQLLLREYLLSVDMLKMLDARLNLRAHYSSWGHDWLSRLWLKDIERFHQYYLSRISIEYDDYAGVLRIQAQAYDAPMAQAIARALIEEGERYMNQLGHEMAETQVNFLTTQVNLAMLRFQQASQALLTFQNQKGLLSPQATAESFNTMVAKLEDQRVQLQTQMAALPKNLDKDHPNRMMLKQSIAALDTQIVEEKAKLADTKGQTLNITLEEFQRLQLDVSFTQELYKAAMTGLEKGRMDATRMLDKVSVLQAPTLPEYPTQPRRIYSSVVTLLFGFMLAGILKLLESIVLDHVD